MSQITMLIRNISTKLYKFIIVCLRKVNDCIWINHSKHFVCSIKNTEILFYNFTLYKSSFEYCYFEIQNLKKLLFHKTIFKNVTFSTKYHILENYELLKTHNELYGNINRGLAQSG